MNILQLKDLLTEKIELLPKCSYRESFKTNFSMDFHKHETIEILYAINKCFEIQYLNNSNLSQPRNVKIQPKQLVILNSNIFHKLFISDDDTKILNIEFCFKNRRTCHFKFDSSALYELDIFKKFASPNKPFYVVDTSNSLVKLLENLQKELLLFPPNTDIDELGDTFFQNNINLRYWTNTLFYRIATVSASNEDNTQLETSKIVKKAINYINENFISENITPNKVSEHLHINHTYLSSEFSKQISMTISAYINNKRISAAAHLLSTTTFPVNQIASQVGYNNRQHFIRQFKKILGITPIEYRKSHSLETLNTHPNNDFVYPVQKLILPPEKK